MPAMWEIWVQSLGWEEGKGYSLQYSCLENSTNWGAWQATVHGVAKNQTWLSYWCTQLRPWHNFITSDQDCFPPHISIKMLSWYSSFTHKSIQNTQKTHSKKWKISGKRAHCGTCLSHCQQLQLQNLFHYIVLQFSHGKINHECCKFFTGKYHWNNIS